MPKPIPTALLLSLGLASGMTTFTGGAITLTEANACYRVEHADGLFPNERYRLDIRVHSRPTSLAEQAQRLHPLQWVYDVHGKHTGTCGDRTVRAVEGTILTTVPLGTPFEARLGLTSYNGTLWSIVIPPAVPFLGCKDVEISCVAGSSVGFPPPTWHCSGQKKFDAEFAFDLKRIPVPLLDEGCSLFESGLSTLPFGVGTRTVGGPFGGP